LFVDWVCVIFVGKLDVLVVMDFGWDFNFEGVFFEYVVGFFVMGIWVFDDVVGVVVICVGLVVDEFVEICLCYVFDVFGVMVFVVGCCCCVGFDVVVCVFVVGSCDLNGNFVFDVVCGFFEVDYDFCGDVGFVIMVRVGGDFEGIFVEEG